MARNRAATGLFALACLGATLAGACASSATETPAPGRPATSETTGRLPLTLPDITGVDRAWAQLRGAGTQTFTRFPGRLFHRPDGAGRALRNARARERIDSISGRAGSARTASYSRRASSIASRGCTGRRPPSVAAPRVAGAPVLPRQDAGRPAAPWQTKSSLQRLRRARLEECPSPQEDPRRPAPSTAGSSVAVPPADRPR